MGSPPTPTVVDCPSPTDVICATISLVSDAERDMIPIDPGRSLPVAITPILHSVHKGRPQQLLRRGAAAMTDRSHEILEDLHNLVRLVSACTLGLWAFAAGLLIGVFLFS